jgi:hypothetical protein
LLLAIMLLVPLGGCQESASPEACAKSVCGPGTGVTEVGSLGRYTDLAIHADGRVVVATYDSTHGNLVARVGLPGEEPTTHLIAGWSVGEEGTVARDSGRWASVASDLQGVSHFAWYEADLGALGYGILTPTGASASEIVDGEAEGDRGTHTSIAIDSDGRVMIAYRDEGARSLRVATREAGASTFEIASIDGCAGEADCPSGAENYGEYASLVFVASQPRIVFYDRARGDLKIALLEAEGWHVVTLDGRNTETDQDTGDAGRFATAALDAKQQLGVAYFDASGGALRYLSTGSTSPHPIIVDRGTYTDELGATRSHVVGQHVALAYDAQGVASMVYLDAGLLALRHVRVHGETPTASEVLTALPPGAYLDLERDPLGGLHLAYGAWGLEDGGSTTLQTATLSWGLDP